MNAKIVCYDETRPAGGEFSKDKPLALFNSFHYFQRARRNRSAITFVATGAEAERAMEVVKELLEKPVNRAEALLEWVAGRPVSFPVANKSPEKAIDDQLRAWGWDGIANERKQQQPRASSTVAPRPKSLYSGENPWNRSTAFNNAPWKESTWK